ncbi:hypothetical protein [Vibrio apostichopi]|uniref:hypothetical protein n=1 Tax=Vibrio apostichopi TaxID=3035453 RepID=UPI002573201E|nr:hypothetical protein [Vibrio sp. FE10]
MKLITARDIDTLEIAGIIWRVAQGEAVVLENLATDHDIATVRKRVYSMNKNRRNTHFITRVLGKGRLAFMPVQEVK